MGGDTKTYDLDRLKNLVFELGKHVILKGKATTGGGRRTKGLLFIIKDFRAADVKELLGSVDFSIPLTSDAYDMLAAFKQIEIENKDLRELVVTDNLTGLYNTRYFRERLQVELERVSRTEKPCSLIMIDLDHFKPVNDTYGHQTGDKLLKSVADIIQTNIRVVDVAVRYGGDEMAVILPDTGTMAAFRMAERIRNELINDRRTAQFGVTGSFGIATCQPYDREDVTGLVERADQALYKSKGEGGNRAWYFESDWLKEKTTEVTVSERDDLFLPVEDD